MAHVLAVGDIFMAFYNLNTVIVNNAVFPIAGADAEHRHYAGHHHDGGG